MPVRDKPANATAANGAYLIGVKATRGVQCWTVQLCCADAVYSRNELRRLGVHVQR